jgi:hypothetical protein
LTFDGATPRIGLPCRSPPDVAKAFLFGVPSVDLFVYAGATLIFL